MSRQPRTVRRDRIPYESHTPVGTTLRLNVLDGSGKSVHSDMASGVKLRIDQPVRLEFVFSTTDAQ